jgi:hypothetical protein
MTSPIALVRDLEARGLALWLDPDGAIHYRGHLAPEDKAQLVAEKDGVKAVLGLRAIHRSWGFDETGIAFIEEAIASGRVTSIEVRSAEAVQ